MLNLLRLVKRISSLAVIMIAFASVAAAATLTVIPQVSTIATSFDSTAAPLVLPELDQRSAVYASDGSFLTYLVAENSEPVSLDEVPLEVIQAVLAMEDWAFYDHEGVNFRGIFRALVENINAGGIEQGGSTITQQLVKLSFLSGAQNLDRKSVEAFYAMRLEEEYTKDELLERYLNTVFFGANAYGIKAAAETYWGIEDLSELGWEEAAMLAGLIRNPNGYNPTVFPFRARDRRNVVVERLLSLELIDETTADQIRNAPLPAERHEPFDVKPTDYFVEEARKELMDTNGPIPLGDSRQERYRQVYFGGLQIHTTFDPAIQAMALATRDEYQPDDPRGFTLAIVAVDTKTSAVRAMVGGHDFTRNQFNLTTDGERQPGSSMKTFVLAALFEAGYTPRDQIRGDSPCSFANPGGYPDPYRVTGGRGGVISLISATAASNNCAFVRLGQVVGNDKVIEVSNKLGLSTLDPVRHNVLSLPLGAVEVHPIEMATSYAAFGNDGLANEAYYVQSIYDRHGELVYEHQENPRRAVSVQTARMVTQSTQAVVTGGTGRQARIRTGQPVAGKTGTSQNHEDAWFVGYTPYLSTAVWLGHPDEKIPMRNVRGWGNVYGGDLPASVWGNFNNQVHENLEVIPFPDPDRYSGGRYLRVPGEIDFCDLSDRGSPTQNTVMVDSDRDGEMDCFRIVTTTTAEEPEEPTPPSDGGAPTPTTTTTPPTTPPASSNPPATGESE